MALAIGPAIGSVQLVRRLRMLNFILLGGFAVAGVMAKTGAATKIEHGLSRAGHAVVHVVHHSKKGSDSHQS